MSATIISLGEGYWVQYDNESTPDEFITKDEYRARFGTAVAPLIVKEKRI